MTVINPKSISGITSITLPSGGDNVLTIHTNDGTERFRVDSSGNVKVGSAATISPDGDVFFTGVTTATTFTGAHSGSGANLTSLPAAQLSGTLPAISAANLTNVPAANITGTLPALTAANLTNIPAANIVGVCTSGLTKTGGFGKILQIGYGFRTGHLQTSSSSYVDSGITTSITPASTSNRILIQINYLGGINGGSTSGQEQQVRILRTIGGTDVEIFTERTADFMRFMVGNAQADYMIAGQLLQNLDYPSTTSEITYKLQCKRSGTGTLAVWAGSNISVMEVTP